MWPRLRPRHDEWKGSRQVLARIDQDILDSGPRRSASRERFCVATRTVRPLSELIRFVAAPDGRVVPDLKRTLPGRGAWVTAKRDVLAQAARRGALQRALGGRATVPADLPAVTERLLEKAVLDALAIAHKAGQVAAGYAKVTDALASGTVVALIHAREAAADGVRKIAAAAQRRAEAASIATIKAFASAELDLALARPNVIHAALLSGHASAAVLERWRSLDRFRNDSVDERGGEEARTTNPALGL
jgi:predicted RNA-binding protein YlxR (DUF448 family)